MNDFLYPQPTRLLLQLLVSTRTLIRTGNTLFTTTSYFDIRWHKRLTQMHITTEYALLIPIICQ